MKLYFPIIYDLKYMIKDLPNLKEVGLNKLGEKLGVITFIYYLVFSNWTSAPGRKRQSIDSLLLFQNA